MITRYQTYVEDLEIKTNSIFGPMIKILRPIPPVRGDQSRLGS